MKRLMLMALLALTACNGPLPNSPSNNPSSSPSSTPDQGGNIFSQTPKKRSLSLDLFQQTGQNGGQSAGDSNNAAQEGASASNTAPAPTADAAIAPGAPTGESRLMAPMYWGGDFNQYVLQSAEESLYPASSATTLLNAYAEMAPLLQDWDPQARLVESQAFVGKGSSDMQYYYLPDANGQPVQTQVKFLFRFASSDLKETLEVYLGEDQTYVHRLVWGEPDLKLDQVKIDSQKAQALAKKAFEDRSLTGDRIYPNPQDVNSGSEAMQIFYSIPDDAHWQLYLNQQGQNKAVYYVNVDFEAPADLQITQPETKPTDDSSVPRPDIDPASIRLYASAEIDAISGEVLSLNRPVYYQPRYYPGDVAMGRAVNEVSVAPTPPVAEPPTAAL